MLIGVLLEELTSKQYLSPVTLRLPCLTGHYTNKIFKNNLVNQNAKASSCNMKRYVMGVFKCVYNLGTLNAVMTWY